MTLNVSDSSNKSSQPTKQETNGSFGFRRLETIIRIAAGAAILVAAMGFPSVYIHYLRFDIPAHFISYDQILRSGVLPALSLALIVFYTYKVAKEFSAEFKGRTAWFKGIPVLLTLILLFSPTILLLLLGSLSLVILCIWGIFWVVLWFISVPFDVNVSNRGLLFFATGFLVLAGSTPIFLARVKGYKWQNIRSRLEDFDRVLTEKARKKSTRWGEIFMKWGFPVCLTLFIGSMYAIKGVVHIWDPEISEVFKHTYIVIIGAGCGALFYLIICLFGIGWIASVSNIIERKGFFILIVIVIYLSLGAAYSYLVYPQVGHGLGGGKPTPVVLWFDKDDMPQDVQATLSAATFTDQGDVIRGEHIYLLYQSSNYLIIVDANTPPASGIVISRDNIKAISW